MAVIDKGSDHETERREPSRSRKVSDRDIVGGKISRRRERPVSNCLGQGRADGESARPDQIGVRPRCERVADPHVELVLGQPVLRERVLEHLDRLLAADHEDGSLDLILMSPIPLELTVFAKAVAHWLTTGLPLVIAAPLLGMLLNLDLRSIGILLLTLLAGTPALTLIGLIGAALAVAIGRGGLLLPILVLPLTVPVLIFGVAVSNGAADQNAPIGPSFMILVALTLASMVIGPFSAAAVLRHGLD